MSKSGGPSLFDQQRFKGDDCDGPWDAREVDRMLNLFFSGIRLGRLAYKMKRTKESVRTYIKELFTNKHGKAERYRPINRVSRKGKPFTKNEVKFWQRLTELGLPIIVVARLCARDESEFKVDKKRITDPDTNQLKQLLPTMDVIWAYRYAYFRYKKKLITNLQYDTLVAEEIEFGGGSTAWERIKAYEGAPPYIRSLSLYLVERIDQVGDNDNAKRSRIRSDDDERETKRGFSQTQSKSLQSSAGSGAERRKRLV